jgi:hypothetical protein
VSVTVAAHWPGPVRRWGGTVAVSFVVAFWITAFFAKRAGHPVAHPLLDVIFFGYLFLSPALGFFTLIFLQRAMKAGVQPKRPLPVQAWLSFAALAAWVVGLGFLDLN